ncbi:MAG TPA: 50S ribosomal protein L24 [Verrucomicrobiae bacterium]|jgi:large subunit ribosomal protein L24|nr:50S ribosomal protein L24 [Verrucomicrobiae bacterium]
MKIKKGDTVIITTGKDRGKKGRVMRIYPKDSQVLVEKINYRTVFLRRTQENPKGGVSKVEGRIHISNVKLVDPKTNEPTRVGYSILADGTKSRISKSSGELL